MRCEEIMKGDVCTVSRDATVQEAARLMVDEDIGFLPVVDGSNRVVGTDGIPRTDAAWGPVWSWCSVSPPTTLP